MIQLTLPPYCILGAGNTRPCNSFILGSTESPNICRYGSELKSALRTYSCVWVCVCVYVCMQTQCSIINQHSRTHNEMKKKKEKYS